MTSYINHPLLKKDAIESRLYQQILAGDVLKKGNTMVVAPTALGKTIVAILVAADRLNKVKNSKVLVLAPSKPLAIQHEDSFKEFLTLPCTSITGAIKTDERVKRWEESRIICATPQTVESDLLNGRYDLSSVSLIVFDECHHGVGSYSYVYLASRYVRESKFNLILGLTASPGSDKSKINEVCKKYGIASIEEAKTICDEKGVKAYDIVGDLQPIAFENAKWAYTLGAAIAIKKGCTAAADAAKAIGEGLQAFCVPGSVADHRKVGLGHGNLGAMLLSEEAGCFAFLAGHESFAAAEGAIGIAQTANKVRKNPLRVILNGLGKDAAQIISRINGFTFVETEYDFKADKVNVVKEIAYSDGLRSKVRCYGAESVQEGVAIMKLENVDISITGNSTNPTRFQHPVAGCYKKDCIENGKKYFSVASGGGTGRTLHPDNMAAGPASYGMTDTMGRMHGDAQFAGSSSVPAHVDMMGLIGAGNNPMVGMTVAVAVAVQEAMSK